MLQFKDRMVFGSPRDMSFDGPAGLTLYEQDRWEKREAPKAMRYYFAVAGWHNFGCDPFPADMGRVSTTRIGRGVRFES